MNSKALRKLLDTPFWPETLKPDTTYSRCHDDHDGTFTGVIGVNIDRMGDVWFMSDTQPHQCLRFRTFLGGGYSLRVRNALLILAEAIRLDNEEKPQPLPIRE